MNARDSKRVLLGHCAAAARDERCDALNQREANVFRLAAMILRPRFPVESTRLMQASERYFRQRPGELESSAEVVRKGWILGAPRLRDRLTMRLRQEVVARGPSSEVEYGPVQATAVSRARR